MMNQGDKHKKGSATEQQVLELFNSLRKTEVVYLERSDFFDLVIEIPCSPPHVSLEFDIALIEVKSAEIIKRNGKGHKVASGCFYVAKGAHEKLVEKNGWYCLVVTFEQKPLITRFIKANSVSCWIGAGKTRMSLATVFSAIELPEFWEIITKG